MPEANASVPRETPGLKVQRAALEDRRAVLGLLLTGRARAQEPAVDQFMAFVAQQQMSIDELWVGARGTHPVACVLLLPAPGRTALVFVSPAGAGSPADLVSVLRAACAALDRGKYRLVQGMVDPWQERERQALLQSGFKALANLVYMERGIEGAPAPAPPLELPEGVTGVKWSAAQRPRFAAAILASYEQTLDCPALVGVRQINDIIDGHMASGQFQPDLWLALSHGEEPVGVMLLSRLPQRQAVELVYLGLAAPWRGRGLGRRLLNHGLALARQVALPAMHLAVDDQNLPAMRLYQSLHFVAQTRKTAMILALPGE